MPAKTIDQLLDDVANHADLDAMIAKTESRLTLLRALRGMEAPNGHVAQIAAAPVKPAAKPSTKKAIAKDDDLDDYDGPPPAKESANSRNANKTGRQMAIVHVLLKGPLRLADIARETGLKVPTVHTLLQSPWFSQDHKGGPYSATDEGKQAINGKAIPATTKPVVPKPTVSAVIIDLAERLGAFLKANGPKQRDALRNALGCNDDQLERVLENPWFEKDDGKFTLSSEGHIEFSRHQEP